MPPLLEFGASGRTSKTETTRSIWPAGRKIFGLLRYLRTPTPEPKVADWIGIIPQPLSAETTDFCPTMFGESGRFKSTVGNSKPTLVPASSCSARRCAVCRRRGLGMSNQERNGSASRIWTSGSAVTLGRQTHCEDRPSGRVPKGQNVARLHKHREAGCAHRICNSRSSSLSIRTDPNFRSTSISASTSFARSSRVPSLHTYIVRRVGLAQGKQRCKMRPRIRLTIDVFAEKEEESS